VLLSISPTKKQIARLTNTKSVVLTRIGAGLNIGGSCLYVPTLYVVYNRSCRELHCRVPISRSRARAELGTQ
jgi:hypothetical protein